MLTSSGYAQYDSWTAPRLITEFRQMLVNMKNTIKSQDENIAQAARLTKEKQSLDKLSADIEISRSALDAEGATHNEEVARFNAQCLDKPVTTQEDGRVCNTWSATLNTANAELTSRNETLAALITDYNSKVERYNSQETARAREAAQLIQKYAEYERNAGLIEARLASMTETSDMVSRCVHYSSAETRQNCLQDIWNREGGYRPYTRNQPL